VPGALAQAPLPARSTEVEAPAPHPGPGLHYDLSSDLAITGGAAALFVSLELLTPALVKSCRWCDRNPDGSDALNSVDAAARKALRWDATQTADVLSSVFSYVLAPLAGIGVGAMVTAHDQRLAEMPEDMLIVAESAFIAIALDQFAKIAFARERPDVHARTARERARLHTAADNLSFFSGHTTLAFALATSAGTIASMRGYRLAPVMWATGLSLATVSGWLRIAADRHYLTDVLTGAAFGAAIGFVVPYLHRERPARFQMSAVPLSRGSVIMLSGVF
jgi:membrane-associated phospholipid phosphatase